MESLVVIVTGANIGIGLALAQSLLEMGHRVAALDLAGENLAPLREGFPDRLRILHCDVSDAEQVRLGVASIVQEWPVIDVLVNNACLATFVGFEDRTHELTRRELEVNVFGYLNLIDAVLPVMKAQGRGTIHNVGSSVGFTGFPGLLGYTASKGAIEALTRTLDLELKPLGIRVNLIHPPLTNTPSASALGVPIQFMKDPAAIGRRLARRIQSTAAVITPDVNTSLGVFLCRCFPGTMGHLLAAMTKRAHAQAAAGVQSAQR
jgi:NAD(P)-dependent dehydrogenase (short-subunit alcohol dehydrogenase family)